MEVKNIKNLPVASTRLNLLSYPFSNFHPSQQAPLMIAQYLHYRYVTVVCLEYLITVLSIGWPAVALGKISSYVPSRSILQDRDPPQNIFSIIIPSLTIVASAKSTYHFEATAEV